MPGKALEIVAVCFRAITRRHTNVSGGNICMQTKLGPEFAPIQLLARLAARSSRERRRGVASPGVAPASSALRGGRGTAEESMGKGSTLFGNAIALTKYCWKC